MPPCSSTRCVRCVNAAHALAPDPAHTEWVQRPSGRVLRVRVYGRPLNRTTGERSRFIGYDDSTVSVEGLVLQLYARNGGWNVRQAARASCALSAQSLL